MTLLGIPVPPGFTITTDVCRLYLRDKRYPEGITEQVNEALRRLEQDTGKQFGGLDNPLLLSVRSGASVSMPGMMETILNLGLNPGTVEALARASSNERFAFDSYRRFIHMYADVVLGVPSRAFDERLREIRTRRGVERDIDLDRRGPSPARGGLQGAGPGGDGRTLPRGSPRAALGSNRGGVPLLERGTGRRVPAGARHPGLPRHGGHRDDHGVRQHG
jgi:hypothetical protein